MLTGENLSRFNADVKTVGDKMLASMKTRMPRDHGELANSAKVKTKQRYGRTERITFSFARHGIFVMKAVGRGVKVGESSSRKATDFYNPAINAHISELENIVDQFINNEVALSIKIGS